MAQQSCSTHCYGPTLPNSEAERNMETPNVSSFKIRDTFNIVSWILSAAIILSCPSFHCVTLYLSSLPDNISPFLFFSSFSPCICPFLLSTLLFHTIISSFRSREQAKRATAIFVCVTPAICSISSLRLFISSQIQCYPSSICLSLFLPSNSLTGHQ